MFEVTDSATYWVILEEGMIKEAVSMLLRLGRRRLGPPVPAIEARIQAITKLEEIEKLLDRLLDVSSWEELMAEL
jgi:hypothetical protein